MPKHRRTVRPNVVRTPKRHHKSLWDTLSMAEQAEFEQRFRNDRRLTRTDRCSLEMYEKGRNSNV